MELLDLPQLAERAGIPVSLARYYRDRFVLFVPSVRIGRTVVHPPEAIPVLQRIHAEAGKGARIEAIVQMLEASSPHSITSAQRLAKGDKAGAAAGMIGSLAAAFDHRGARIEQELTALRTRIGETLSAVAMQAAVTGTIETEVSRATTELATLKEAMTEVRVNIGQLASHDQLEWIGDVVAAAVIAPQAQPLDASVEQRLAELQQDIRRLRPSTEAAELRVAVERLTDYVHHRDAELRRSFQSLVGALRSEVRGMRTAVDELRQFAGGEADLSERGPVTLSTIREMALGDVRDAHERGGEASIEALRPRAPRRLGQPNKPADGIAG
jgi:DNA-binding transcriptional MerR regulator